MSSTKRLGGVVLSLACLPTLHGEQSKGAGTPTEWRNDEKNLIVVRKLNRAYERLPFSREYEGVRDRRPFRLEWSLGPNVPVAWKGGVAGVFGDQIALVGGLWMPGRKNLAFAYNVKTQTYAAILPPPFETAYTQGACDGENLYVVGGRSAGRRVAKLTRSRNGNWQWTALPMLPASEEKGRWLASVGLVPGKWLFLCAGHPTGTPSEIRTDKGLPDLRLRLDKPDAQWELMARYPGGARSLTIAGVVGNKLYLFGGSLTDAEMREIFLRVAKEHGLWVVPYNGVPNYRDAYSYDPQTNRWRTIRSLPFPVLAGSAVSVDDRYLLLMGSADVRTFRVGRSRSEPKNFWRGYGDIVLCYDTVEDNYSRIGVLPYGVATCPWVTDGKRVYGFGGEPAHGYIANTENVAQIATIKPAVPPR